MATDWRKLNPPKQYDDDDLHRMGKQSLAVRRVNQAIKNGTLTRAARCEVCNEDCVTVAHHWRGYDYPFSVWWVCRVCNANLDVHDGSLSLDEAREYLRAKYREKVEKRMRIYKWLHKQWQDCDVCGCWCKLPEMHQCDELQLCHYCNEQVFGQEA